MSKESYAASFNPPPPVDDGLDTIDRDRIRISAVRRRKYERLKAKQAAGKTIAAVAAASVDVTAPYPGWEKTS